MKFVVSSSLLSQRLQTLGRVIASKNSLPILDSFLFRLEGQQLHLTASDNETSILTSIDLVECESDLTFAINANTPPMLAAWIPNILYFGIAYLCYRKAPN